jgi:hypothetical protein
MVFVQRPISAGFIAVSALLIAFQIFFAMRAAMHKRRSAALRPDMSGSKLVMEDD